MKMVCTKKNLNASLTITSRVIGSGNTLPILNNILLKTDKGRLKLSTTNLEMAISTWVGGKIEEEGAITVPARLINEYVSNLTAEKISISTENRDLLLEAENTQTHMKGLPADDFPLIPEVGNTLYTRIDSKQLQQTIREVVYAAAFSETQPEISGVLFNFEGKTLLLAATDRYRLAEGKVELSEEVPSPKQIIVPSRAVNELDHLLTGEGAVEVFLKEGQVCFKAQETELVSRLIEGQYPDYRQIIPKSFLTEAEVERNTFAQALKATSLFATESNNIEFNFSPQAGGAIIIKSQSAQTGDSEIRVPSQITGQKNSIVFNYRYILECLNHLSDEKIILRAINSSSPAEISPMGRGDYLYIVMPIKI